MPQMKKIQAGGGNYLSPKDMTVGQELEGIFVQRRSSRNFPDQNNYTIFTTDEEEVILNGTKQLDYLFEDVEPGSYIRLTYEGKRKLTSGENAGTMAHQFELEVAEDEDDQTAELRAKSLQYNANQVKEKAAAKSAGSTKTSASGNRSVF